MPDLSKTVMKNRPKKSQRYSHNFNSDELAGIFRPIAAQFTLIKTDQKANVKWGVRFYRD